MTSSILRGLLIFLLVFNAIGAYYGSFLLISDPTGVTIQLPPDMAQRMPFPNFLIPGIILLLVNGVLPTLAAAGLLFRRPARPLPAFPVVNAYHWGWSLALMSGIGLLIWIGVQIALLGYWSDFPIQAVYGALGAVITGLALAVRNAYRLEVPR